MNRTPHLERRDRPPAVRELPVLSIDITKRIVVAFIVGIVVGFVFGALLL